MILVNFVYTVCFNKVYFVIKSEEKLQSLKTMKKNNPCKVMNCQNVKNQYVNFFLISASNFSKSWHKIQNVKNIVL